MIRCILTYLDCCFKVTPTLPGNGLHKYNTELAWLGGQTLPPEGKRAVTFDAVAAGAMLHRTRAENIAVAQKSLVERCIDPAGSAADRAKIEERRPIGFRGSHASEPRAIAAGLASDFGGLIAVTVEGATALRGARRLRGPGLG